MAVFVFKILAPDDLRIFGDGQVQVDPNWSVSTSGRTLTVTDDDSTFSGDSTDDEIGNDANQTAVVRDIDNDTLASGQVYLEAVATLTDGEGDTIQIYAVEIGGTLVGYTSDAELTPGVVYDVATLVDVANSPPSYSSLKTQTFDQSADNAIDGGAYGDRLYGGAGSDEIWGDGGSDGLYGGAGTDALYGGAGADRLFGGSEADLLYGGDGGDILSGGGGADILSGGAGDDRLTGGSGDDSFVLDRGGGSDTITDFDLADADGDGFSNDQLDISGLTGPSGSVYARDVTVSDDGAGNALLSFPNGESVRLIGVSPDEVSDPGQMMRIGIPCFARGTRIATPGGQKKVECLQPGDRVATLDHGPQPVLWHGATALSAAAQRARPKLQPVRIAPGSLGNSRALRVSPQHALLLGDACGGEHLVRARHLTGASGAVRQVTRPRAEQMHHLLLPQHALIRAEGVLCESFWPGVWAMRSLGAGDLAELLGVLPTLAAVLRGAKVEAVYGPPARPVANPRLARRLRQRHLVAAPGKHGSQARRGHAALKA